MKQLKITVSMLQRHVAEIDRWRVNMRLREGAIISRSAVIRALIDLAMQKDQREARKR